MYDDVPWYVELWRSWMEMFQDGAIGITFGVIIGLIVAGLALLVLSGIFHAADKWFTPKQEGSGRVAKRWIREGYWTDQAYSESEWGFGLGIDGKYGYGYHSITKYRKVWVEPQPMLEVFLIEGGATREFEVNQVAYDNAKEQTPVRISFQRGRFSGTTYINSYVRA